MISEFLTAKQCGMAGALETLCGQAYGAEQYKKLGIYTYAAIISLILVCIPISILWMFTDKLLILIGQDPTILHIAHKYCVCLIPNMFAYAILQPLVRYYQTQSLILPLLFSSFAALCFHIPFCWTLVFKLKLGSSATALASASSYLLDVLMLGVYMKYSSACEKTRAVFSKDAFFSMREFFRFAVPSAGMVCLEWWSFEGLILHSGLLPNPELETSVLSLCTRVSNELGAGNAQAAKMTVKAIMVLVVAEMVIVAMILFFCHRVLGYAFSSKKEIVDRTADMAPLLCLSIIMDGLQAVLSDNFLTFPSCNGL
nr:protein detoxification 14 [Quercus suber]